MTIMVMVIGGVDVDIDVDTHDNDMMRTMMMMMMMMIMMNNHGSGLCRSNSSIGWQNQSGKKRTSGPTMEKQMLCRSIQGVQDLAEALFM